MSGRTSFRCVYGRIYNPTMLSLEWQNLSMPNRWILWITCWTLLVSLWPAHTSSVTPTKTMPASRRACCCVPGMCSMTTCPGNPHTNIELSKYGHCTLSGCSSVTDALPSEHVVFPGIPAVGLTLLAHTGPPHLSFARVIYRLASGFLTPMDQPPQ